MNRLIYRLMAPIMALMLIAGSALTTVAQESTPEAAGADEESISRAIALYPEDSGPETIISIELDAGESMEINIVLGNAGNIEQTLRTYKVNALSSANGGYSLADYEAEAAGATNWLEYPEQQHTLESGEGLVVPLVIAVPEDATPGEYVTGLAAEQADPFEIPGSTMLNQRVRWALPVQVIVPGERQPAFETGNSELKWMEDRLIATTEIANTGNVTVRPAGEVRLLNSEGTVIGTSEVEMAAVYNGTSTHFVTAWRDVPQSDTYTVQVVLTAEEGTVTVEQEYTDLVPLEDDSTSGSTDPLSFSSAEISSATDDVPPSVLVFEGTISNAGSAINEARVSIVTYKDGEEIDRYPVMQAVTLATGDTPIEARYSLPGGFTDGTYTFEVTIELGSGSTQSVLVTHPLEFSVTIGD